MSCSGIHREFSARVKGIGASSFTAEEVARMRQPNAGNEAVNAVYMARYNPSTERLKAPTDNSDQQLLRVWIRRKYVDKAWHQPGGGGGGGGGGDGTAGGAVAAAASGGGGQGQPQPTMVKIPGKKPSAASAAAAVAAPPSDLLDFGAAPSAPAPAAPAPAAPSSWDAFGGSSGGGGGGGGATNVDAFGGQQQPATFQANFDQMPAQPPPQPPQQHPAAAAATPAAAARV